MKKIAFVQTYPVYHDLITTDQWFNIENRDKWMPGILTKKGFDVELWGVAETDACRIYKNKKFGSYPIRLFEVSEKHQRTKFDYSMTMVQQAKKFNPDLLILKGVDGGAGIKLLDEYILPHRKPFVFVIGGKFYNKYVPKAQAIFYETSFQRRQLIYPTPFSLRKKIPDQKLFYLPKSINTVLFRPDPSSEKSYDIISVGRLIPNYKNYDALGTLSSSFRVALVGDGPLKRKLKAVYPNMHFTGAVHHEDLPRYLNQAKIFFYPGRKDFFPRVIPEAMATGLPCIAFDKTISKDVIPGNCGLRISVKGYLEPVSQLLGDPSRIRSMAQNARNYVEHNYGLNSSEQAMHDMLQLIV